jgi:MFS family permease
VKGHTEKGEIMKLIRYWRRIAVVLTGLGVTMGALASAASAATGSLPPAAHDADVVPTVQTVVVGGMPGWQIALIAVGAALLAAAAAVLLDRARPGRRRLAGEAA